MSPTVSTEPALQARTASLTVPRSVSSVKTPSLVDYKGKVLRTEPKTYFTNERTFLRWLTIAMLLFTLNIGLFHLGDDVSGIALNTYAGEHIISTLLMPFALIIMWWAYYQYIDRVKKLDSRSDGPFYDAYGVPVLTFLLCFVLITLVVAYWYNVIRDSSLQDSLSLAGFPLVKSEVCSMLAFTGLAPFYQPSSLLYNSVSNTLYTCSANQVSTLNLGIPNAQWVSYHLPNQNVVSIASTNDASDVIYLGSDSPYPAILEFNRTARRVTRTIALNDAALHVVSNLRGLSYVPALPYVPLPLFFLATTENIIGLSVNLTAAVPLLTVGFTIPLFALSEISSGMAVVSDMTLVGSTLYILLGKMRLLRSYDLTTGRPAGNWRLPGLATSWAGVALVPEPGSLSRMKAFLASDSSEQIWGFEFNTVDGFSQCREEPFSLGAGATVSLIISLVFIGTMLAMVGYFYYRWRAEKKLGEKGDHDPDDTPLLLLN